VPVNILIIDDQPLVLAGLTAILETNGFTCRSAVDGFAALHHFREQIPDVIICDLNMPNMSGFELLSIVRREYPQIAVIVLSGEYLANMEPSGVLMNAFFQKGQYQPEELVQTIRRLYTEAPLRSLATTDLAPIWMNRRDHAALLVTCTGCLHSFPVASTEEPAGAESQSVTCPSCGDLVTYSVQSVATQVLEPIQRAVADEPEEHIVSRR
jgi:CheY-like chemotaxis protein